MVLDKSGIAKTGNPFIACQYRLVETEGQYPQSCVIDVFGDRLPTLNVGDIAEVDFNMKCDEYQGKLYGKNNAWKITVKEYTSPGGPTSQPQTSIPANQPSAPPVIPESADTSAGEDDLQF